MQIYILRHGIAEESHPGGNDADRVLTAEGKRRLREVLRIAKKAGVRIDVIISSPYARALETARIAEEIFDAHDVFTTETLIPSSEPQAVWDQVRLHREAESVLVVGHEPLLSQVTGFLLAAPTLFVDMKKGALVRIDVQHLAAHPRGILKWMLAPKLALTS